MVQENRPTLALRGFPSLLWSKSKEIKSRVREMRANKNEKDVNNYLDNLGKLLEELENMKLYSEKDEKSTLDRLKSLVEKEEDLTSEMGEELVDGLAKVKKITKKQLRDERKNKKGKYPHIWDKLKTEWGIERSERKESRELNENEESFKNELNEIIKNKTQGLNEEDTKKFVNDLVDVFEEFLEIEEDIDTQEEWVVEMLEETKENLNEDEIKKVENITQWLNKQIRKNIRTAKRERDEVEEISKDVKDSYNPAMDSKKFERLKNNIKTQLNKNPRGKTWLRNSLKKFNLTPEQENELLLLLGGGGKTIKTESGNIVYEDSKETHGNINMVVRRIKDINGQLVNKMRKRDFLLTKEGINLLRELTNNRYPSFYTFSHAFGGSDFGALYSEKWFDEKGFHLFNEEVGGICVASPINRRGFWPPKKAKKEIKKGSERVRYSRSKVDTPPLFVFGNRNPGFMEFLKTKYRKVLGKEKSKELLSKENYSYLKIEKLSPDSEIYKESRGSFHGVLKSLYEDEQRSTVLERVVSVYDIEKPGFVTRGPLMDHNEYDPIRRRYKPILKSDVQLDYSLLFDLPIFADDEDGVFIHLDGSIDIEGKMCDLNWENIPPPERRPARWKDAEMMIDMYGLFDGFKKIIFFQ